MTKNNFIGEFLKLFIFLDKRHRIKFYYSIFLMVIFSLLEVISIGALIPFVTAILSPEKLFELEFIKNFDYINELESINLQLFFTFFFVLSVLISNIFRIYVLYNIAKLSKLIPLELSTKIYKTIINQNYDNFKQKNSSELISLITDKMDSLGGVFFSFLNAAASLITCFGIISLLFFINYKITIISLASGILLYFFMGVFVKSILKRNSINLAQSSIARIKHVRETFGSIKQVILENKQNFFHDIFFNHEEKFRTAQFKHQFLNSSPRFLVEGIGIIVIAIFIYVLFKELNYDAIFIISLVGVIAFAFQKILPNINMLYVCYSSIINFSTFINEVHLNLKQINSQDQNKTHQNKQTSEISFKDNIKLNNVSFKYNSNNQEVIKNLNILIKKGSKVGLKGPTGSGKTTCLDIIMGLLKPYKGTVMVDGLEISKTNINSWQNKISHVPQDIFLIDASIKENIVFNFDPKNIDMKKVIECSKLAEIHDFIDQLPDKYDTKVGENGTLLSGGQKQRIGIARALFDRKEILTLDEATSALDIETEQRILNNINKIVGITIIQITHRENNLNKYDSIVKL